MTDDAPLHMVHGTLEAFFEQGMDGHAWCLYEEGKSGYEGLHPIRKGDILMVFNDAARREPIFEAVIDLDYTSNIQPLPSAKHLTAQWIKNLGSVTGIQKGIEPEAWAQMFIDEKPATLIVNPKNMRH